jgi:dihydropteroate synthase
LATESARIIVEYDVVVETIQDPESEIRNPKSEIQSPESEIRSPKSEVRNPESEIRNPKSEIRNPKSEIQSPKSEVRDPKSEIQSSESEIRNLKSEIQSSESEIQNPKYLFVTGRLAEFALRQVLAELAPQAGFTAEVAVLPISVAALMTPQWLARHLRVPEGVGRVIIPGSVHGDLTPIVERARGTDVGIGPADLRDLPRYFGQEQRRHSDYGAYDIEILAEINHAPRLERAELIRQAEQFRAEGADVIDLGCDPGMTWTRAGETVSALLDRGMRVSIDSFDPAEVKLAAAAGAELVLSVNATNRRHARDWGVEVVAIPDQPGSLDGLDETVEFLDKAGVPFRIDPVVEPIGFGFAASLGRFLEVRRRYPQAPIMMGVGNLTELTDVDSAGVNTILLGFCQELSIKSVLSTAVINWARSSVRELDLARRLVFHAVTHRTLAKHLEPRLVMLRDPKVVDYGADNLAELQRRIRDPNWRVFAEGGTIYVCNNAKLLSDPDPFVLFDQMHVADAGHAFYLGYELMKAKTALTLDKSYRQDQALEWGFLTEVEMSHTERRRHTRSAAKAATDGPAAGGELDEDREAQADETVT